MVTEPSRFGWATDHMGAWLTIRQQNPALPCLRSAIVAPARCLERPRTAPRGLRKAGNGRASICPVPRGRPKTEVNCEALLLPLEPAQRRERGVEGAFLGERGEVAEEGQAAGLVERGEAFEKEPAEETRQHAHGQEEAGLAGDPARPVAGRDDVDVGMVGERRAPGVQHGGEADARAQMLRVGGEGGQRLGGGPEQEVVDGACPDIRRSSKSYATPISSRSVFPKSERPPKPNSVEPPWYGTRMPGGVGGVASRGVPLSRSKRK